MHIFYLIFCRTHVKIAKSDVKAYSGFTAVKNVYSSGEFNLDYRVIRDKNGELLANENKPIKSSTSYPKDAFYWGSSVKKVTDNANTLGISVAKKDKLNSDYSKKNRLYAMYNISPLADVDDVTNSFTIDPNAIRDLTDEYGSNIKKALRLDWETKEYNSGSGSVFGRGQAFTLKGAYAEDSNFSHTGTNGESTDNSGQGELASLASYYVKLLNGTDALTEARNIDSIDKPSSEVSNAQFANYVLEPV